MEIPTSKIAEKAVLKECIFDHMELYIESQFNKKFYYSTPPELTIDNACAYIFFITFIMRMIQIKATRMKNAMKIPISKYSLSEESDRRSV